MAAVTDKSGSENGFKLSEKTFLEKRVKTAQRSTPRTYLNSVKKAVDKVTILSRVLVKVK